MTTPNRGLVNDVENTLQPGVAHNWLADVFDRRFGALTIDFASDANLDLSQVQSDYGMIMLTDTGPVLTTGRDVVFPAHFPMIFVANATAQTITLKMLGQTGVALAAGESATLVSGPTDVVYTSAAVIGAGGPNSTYRTVINSTGSHIAARVAGTYGLGQGNPAAISGTGTLYSLNAIYIDSSDFPTVDGLTTKLRVRAALAVNDVAPTGNYTFGLHPVTRPATSGGAGLNIYTIGAAVAGSTVTVTTPAADSHNNAVGSDFALPANGFYVLGMVTTATVAASSHLHISMALQQRNT